MFYERRDRFSQLSVKVGIMFAKLRLSPNQWTLVTIIPTLVALWFLVRQDFLSAAALFIVASFIDLVDGSVARVTGRVSTLGAYLDTVVDRYVEGIIIFGLLFASLPEIPELLGIVPITLAGWILVYLFGSMMTTYSKSAAKEKGIVENELKGGIFERAERLIVLFLGILLAGLFGPLFLSYIIVLLAILTNLSAIQRILIAVRYAK